MAQDSLRNVLEEVTVIMGAIQGYIAGVICDAQPSFSACGNSSSLANILRVIELDIWRHKA